MEKYRPYLFQQKGKDNEDMQQQRTGQRPRNTQTYQMREQMWNQIVAEKIFFAEEKNLESALHLELSSILKATIQITHFSRTGEWQDPATGKLDPKSTNSFEQY